MSEIDRLRASDSLLFDCISGSRAYGTDTPESDTDLKGVFVVPKEGFYGLESVDQVNDASHDQCYYELRRFVELLCKSNPNLLEMLYAPEDCILKKDPLFDLLDPQMFLSRKCEETFANFAMHQIRKARGLNKKIANPMHHERKSILAFCYVLEGQGSVLLMDWLKRRSLKQIDCGLVRIPHMRDVYGLYHEPGAYRGILSKPEASEVLTSSVPKEAQPIAWMSFNKDGYKKYCKEFHAYWNWVSERNETRYQTHLEHGKNYDSKNLMHTFRLLDMAAEIAREGTLTVRRPNRDFLLEIRSGAFSYDALMHMAEERLATIHELFSKSSLPAEPDRAKAESTLIRIRSEVYFQEN